MAFTYMNSEPGLWTVGAYGENGKWVAESDHADHKAASERVHYLNGGDPTYDDIVRELMVCAHKLESVARDINESNPETASAMRTIALHAKNALAAIGYIAV